MSGRRATRSTTRANASSPPPPVVPKAGKAKRGTGAGKSKKAAEAVEANEDPEPPVAQERPQPRPKPVRKPKGTAASQGKGTHPPAEPSGDADAGDADDGSRKETAPNSRKRKNSVASNAGDGQPTRKKQAPEQPETPGADKTPVRPMKRRAEDVASEDSDAPDLPKIKAAAKKTAAKKAAAKKNIEPKAEAAETKAKSRKRPRQSDGPPIDDSDLSPLEEENEEDSGEEGSVEGDELDAKAAKKSARAAETLKAQLAAATPTVVGESDVIKPGAKKQHKVSSGRVPAGVLNPKAKADDSKLKADEDSSDSSDSSGDEDDEDEHELPPRLLAKQKSARKRKAAPAASKKPARVEDSDSDLRILSGSEEERARGSAPRLTAKEKGKQRADPVKVKEEVEDVKMEDDSDVPVAKKKSTPSSSGQGKKKQGTLDAWKAGQHVKKEEIDSDADKGTLKPKKRTIKAEGVRRPKPIELTGASTDEECQPITREQMRHDAALARKKKRDDAEEIHDETTRIVHNLAGGLDLLKNQHPVLHEGISGGMAKLKEIMFLDKSGNAWPPKDEQEDDEPEGEDGDGEEREAEDKVELSKGLAIAGAALLAVLETDGQYKACMARARSDPKWLRHIARTIWARRSAMRNLLIEIGKTMMDEGAFGLMKFVKKKMSKNDIKRLKNAALALLENRSFVYRGALVRKGKKDEDTKVIWQIDPEDSGCPYGNPLIAEYVSRAMCGKGKDKGSLKFQAKQFPEEDHDPSDPTSDPKKLDKIAPRPMVVFAATMLEMAIRDWQHGSFIASSAKENDVAPLYAAHDTKMDEYDPGALEGTFCAIYKAAMAWKPRQAHVDFGSAGAMKGTKAEVKAHYAKIAAAQEASSSRVD